jgi:LCP family protein required for cell wall assembly
MSVDRLWTCPRCRTDNLGRSEACRRCALPRPRASGVRGGPAFAAVLSALLPGLGQLYQDRWVRGLLMLLVPALVLLLGGAFVLLAEPVTRAVIQRAALVALLVVGTLFAYHVVVVADAFAGHLGPSAGARGRRLVDYLVLAIVTLGLVGAYGTVYRESAAWAGVVAKVFEPIARGQLASPEESAPPQWSGRDRLNVLLLGIDRRPENNLTENTDTVIVLSLDPLNGTAAMLSIPRDTLVTIPGHGPDKINAAYSYGGAQRGPELARRTVEGLLGIPLHSFALIDFAAFTRIVDSFGGVPVDVKRPLRDEEYPTADFGIERVLLHAGPQLLDGTDALRYARSRHDSNDFGRARRQQDVLAGLRVRLAQGGLGRLPLVVDRVGTAVQTNFDPSNILPLARTGIAIDSAAITSEVMLPCDAPGAEHCELNEENSALGYYLIPDKAKVAGLVARLFYDPRVRQEAARVEVRGTGARRTAVQEVASRLGERSFSVARVSDGATARSTVVLRNTAKRYSADVLAKQLGLGVTVETAETADADIVVRLGSDFRGVASDLLR